jgi:TM2 domain-containing membrane protein YozV
VYNWLPFSFSTTYPICTFMFFKKKQQLLYFRLLRYYLLFITVSTACYGAPLPVKKLPVTIITYNATRVKLITVDYRFEGDQHFSDSTSVYADLNQLNAIEDSLPVKPKENKRIIAAILASPLFGIVGLHRIYLGTKSYVPVIYIVTVGGCFGILPLIDLVILLRSTPEQIERYQNNPHLFMWMDK